MPAKSMIAGVFPGGAAASRRERMASTTKVCKDSPRPEAFRLASVKRSSGKSNVVVIAAVYVPSWPLANLRGVRCGGRWEGREVAYSPVFSGSVGVGKGSRGGRGGRGEKGRLQPSLRDRSPWRSTDTGLRQATDGGRWKRMFCCAVTRRSKGGGLARWEGEKGGKRRPET